MYIHICLCLFVEILVYMYMYVCVYIYITLRSSNERWEFDVLLFKRGVWSCCRVESFGIRFCGCVGAGCRVVLISRLWRDA